ncbi:uncharacterized protein LOC111800185 [Cucurbita pepo subsp. pepo]|uniref:uncharacterized protein LOC111800185 n=1 Tax=Cucurbita pepo subsp. pepo TaxID=3664 RepID=UPI000C9D4514|nr:uncharacterized protein LOC111800185 [Cucurbita pepo subsp. pepo]
MTRKSSKRVSFSPDVNDNPTVVLKHGGGEDGAGTLSFGLSRDTRHLPVGFLQSFKARVSEAIRFVSTKKSSRKVSSAATFTRSRSVSDSMESHRAEAIEDCIEFLNHSSSLSRLNSVSGSTY